MLESSTISGVACFGSLPLAVNPFGVATFVFGPNGSGKTSISRALADPLRFPGTKHHWGDDSPLDVKVYNKDFVEKVIEQYSRLEGVFLLGEENVEKRIALEAIVGENGEKSKAETKRKRTASNLTKNGEELAAAKRRLTDDAWGKRSEAPRNSRSLSTDSTDQRSGSSRDCSKLRRQCQRRPMPTRIS